MKATEKGMELLSKFNGAGMGNVEMEPEMNWDSEERQSVIVKVVVEV